MQRSLDKVKMQDMLASWWILTEKTRFVRILAQLEHLLLIAISKNIIMRSCIKIYDKNSEKQDTYWAFKKCIHCT